jgi:hypothetical protein
VAKRSVRRARAREQQQPPVKPEPAARRERRPTGFWLGVLMAAAVLIPVAVVAVLVIGDRTDESPAANTSAAPNTTGDDEAAEFRRRFAARDKEQIEDLTRRARAMVEDFTPAVAGLGRTLPAGTNRIGPLAGRDQVEEWRRTLRDADEFFEQSVSGETATNVARNALASSVDALLEALNIYVLALEHPGVRSALMERAREQRDLAARTWSNAATQLDLINIDAGFGHQHVVFPSSSKTGATAPDSLPEGTDAEPPPGER